MENYYVELVSKAGDVVNEFDDMGATTIEEFMAKIENTIDTEVYEKVVFTNKKTGEVTVKNI